MKKLLLFILGFMLMALSACQPVQNTMENSPDGILSIQFEKTVFSIDENIDATICIGMEDGYENYVNEHPNITINELKEAFNLLNTNFGFFNNSLNLFFIMPPED